MLRGREERSEVICDVALKQQLPEVEDILVAGGKMRKKCQREQQK